MNKKREVDVYNKHGMHVKHCVSVSECAEYLGVDVGYLNRCINSDRRVRGYSIRSMEVKRKYKKRKVEKDDSKVNFNFAFWGKVQASETRILRESLKQFLASQGFELEGIKYQKMGESEKK